MNERIAVEAMGGEIGERRMAVPSSARFSEGESTLMFLGVFRRRIALYLVLLPLLMSLLMAVYLNLNVGW